MQRWSWESLQSAVQHVIDRGGIGRPMALRLTVHARGSEAEARESLRKAEALATAWFGGRPDSAYSVGGPAGDRGEHRALPTVTALKWASGECAVLSVSAGEHGPVGGNAMLMGSRGTIYHEIDNSGAGSSTGRLE